jgi:hypothetical protein
VAEEDVAAYVPSLAFVAVTVHDPASSTVRTLDDERVHAVDPVEVT